MPPICEKLRRKADAMETGFSIPLGAGDCRAAADTIGALYEALEQLLSAIEVGDKTDVWQAAGRAALAKARGEQ
jgi:hypothetical protein